MSMNTLPVEILWKIFSYIPAQERLFSVAEVCQLWYDLVYSNDTFINQITFVIYLEDLYIVKNNRLKTGLGFHEISSGNFCSFPFVKSVKVATGEIEIFKFNAIQYVLTTFFKSIVKLEFVNVHAIPISFFNAIFRSLCQLEVFKINMCYFTNVEAFLEMRHLKNLTTFELLNGYYFCDRHLELLASECPLLSHVWIPDSRAVSDSALIDFIRLKKVNLMHLAINGYLITDTFYSALVECKNLVTFYVEDARKMSEKGMKVLLSLPKLENLTLKSVTLNFNDQILNLVQVFLAKQKKLVCKDV